MKVKAIVGTFLAAIAVGCGKPEVKPLAAPVPPPIGEAELGQLRNRVEKLEDLVATQKAAVVELQNQPPLELPAVIEAEGFVVKGKDGKVRARLGVDRLGKLEAIPGLYVYDTNGTKRAVVVETGWSGGLATYDSRGQYRVVISQSVSVRTLQGIMKDLGDQSRDPKRLACPQKPPPADWMKDGPPQN